MLGGSLDSIVDPATDRSCDSVSDGFAVEFVHGFDIGLGVLYQQRSPLQSVEAYSSQPNSHGQCVSQRVVVVGLGRY